MTVGINPDSTLSQVRFIWRNRQLQNKKKEPLRMALTNPIKNQPTVLPNTFHLTYDITLADIKALGAFVTGDITLFSLPAGSLIVRTVVTPVTAVTGLTTCVGYVKTTNHNYGSVTFDLKGAVTATNRDLYATEQIETATPVLFHMISTVDNLSAATAGEVQVVVEYIVR